MKLGNYEVKHNLKEGRTEFISKPIGERYIEICGSLFSPEEYEKLKGKKNKIEKLKLYTPYPECEDTRFEDIENKINEIIDIINQEENK